MPKQGFTTRQVHADRLLNQPESGAVHTASTNSVLFEFKDAQGIIDVFQGKKAGHVYSRSSSPSVVSLQNMINQLEQGVGAVCFTTGMAAISAMLLALFKKGDHLVVSQFLFGNTRSFMDTVQDLGIEVSFVDVTDIQVVSDAIKPNTKAVFAETVANPVTQVADINGLSELCKQQNALLIVDTTMTPAPLFDAKKAGADLVVTSLTKYIGGHGNVLGGAIVDTGNFDWSSFSNIKAFYRGPDQGQWGLTQIRKKGLRDMGATLSSESAAAISVGMETLDMRMQRNCANAMALATYLQAHEKVKSVYYPGLTDHPQHDVASDQFSHFGAILSLDLDESIDPVEFLNALELVICATHLGDNRTLALPVAPTIFFENGPEERAKMGISETMIRVSVGIENTQDIIDDFEQALAQM